MYTKDVKKHIRAHTHTHTHTHTQTDKYIHIYIYIYIEREREREKERGCDRRTSHILKCHQVYSSELKEVVMVSLSS